MRGIVHFAIVAGATTLSMQLAARALDAVGMEQAPGFGFDDVAMGVLVAAGVSLTLGVLKSAGIH